MYPLNIKEKYEQNNLINLAHRFTTLYLGNYISWDMRENVWSHPWVDIYPEKKNDDVFCVLNWKVYKVWEDWMYWKYVFIKHQNIYNPDDFTKKTTLYSCYLHLSETLVKKNDTIKEWKIIWKTWNTWNSYWEHLHFQIDKASAPYHSYWPFTSSDSKKAWVSFLEAVNIWLWINNAKLHTINPLVYLDKIKELKNKITISSSNTNNNKLTKKLDKAFKKVKNKLSKKNIEKQIIIYENLENKISKILEKLSKFSSKYETLSYLKILITKELKILYNK